jgi:hypothetical protein
MPVQPPGQLPLAQLEWFPQWNWKVPMVLKVSVTGKLLFPLSEQEVEPLSMFKGWIPALLPSQTTACPCVIVKGVLKAVVPIA